MNLNKINYEATKHGAGDFTKVLAKDENGKYHEVNSISIYKGLAGLKVDPELEMQGQKCIILELTPVELP